MSIHPKDRLVLPTNKLVVRRAEVEPEIKSPPRRTWHAEDEMKAGKA